MRRLFLVLAKLVGLLQVYWALVNFMQIGFILSMIGRSEPSHFVQLIPSLVGIGLYFALSLGMAWLLLARTEWLADKVKIHDDEAIESLDKHPVLAVGVKLIGVYVTAYSIPSFVRVLLESRQILEGQLPLHLWNKIIPSALQLCLGLFMAMKSDKVIELITRKKDSTEQTSPGDIPSAAPEE